MKRLKRLLIIPARGGSKRIKNKNIKKFKNKSIIYYNIENEINSKLFNKINVSTDSKLIKKTVERKLSIDFLRSKKLAGDNIPLFEVYKFVVEEYSKKGLIFDEIWSIMSCAPNLNVKDLDFFYSSPLLRAKQTAEIINQKFNLEIKFTNNLREYNYGIAEGKNWMVATTKFGIQLGAWGFGNIKGEEGPIEFCERVDTFVDNLLNDCINKNVVCVSHGAVINRVASFILGLDVENRPRIKINNTSVMAVDNSKNKPTIVTINDCMHLL